MCRSKIPVSPIFGGVSCAWLAVISSPSSVSSFLLSSLLVAHFCPPRGHAGQDGDVRAPEPGGGVGDEIGGAGPNFPVYGEPRALPRQGGCCFELSFLAVVAVAAVLSALLSSESHV